MFKKSFSLVANIFLKSIFLEDRSGYYAINCRLKQYLKYFSLILDQKPISVNKISIASEDQKYSIVVNVPNRTKSQVITNLPFTQLKGHIQ